MVVDPSAHRTCRIVELRRYELLPGRRDELIELFDREFVEPQEDVGAHVLGQFVDIDRPDRFTWLRGFDSMTARHSALTNFYLRGRAWATHRAAANATMLDSDNVLLLQPVAGLPDLCGRATARPGFGEPAGDTGVFTMTIHHSGARPDEVLESVRRSVAQRPDGVIGVLRSEHSENTFPALPVVEDAEVVVVVRRHDSHEDVGREADARPMPGQGRCETLVLEPTARSALR